MLEHENITYYGLDLGNGVLSIDTIEGIQAKNIGSLYLMSCYSGRRESVEGELSMAEVFLRTNYIDSAYGCDSTMTMDYWRIGNNIRFVLQSFQANSTVLPISFVNGSWIGITRSDGTGYI